MTIDERYAAWVRNYPAPGVGIPYFDSRAIGTTLFRRVFSAKALQELEDIRADDPVYRIPGTTEHNPGWLKRSLAAIEAQVRDWPAWKREAASSDPLLAIPAPAARSHGPGVLPR